MATVRAMLNWLSAYTASLLLCSARGLLLDWEGAQTVAPTLGHAAAVALTGSEQAPSVAAAATANAPFSCCCCEAGERLAVLGW